MYRMTFNHRGVSGCSARGIAKRETKSELLELAESLKESICNIKIEEINSAKNTFIPLDPLKNLKK